MSVNKEAFQENAHPHSPSSYTIFFTQRHVNMQHNGYGQVKVHRYKSSQTFINRILLHSVKTHCILVVHFTKGRPPLHPCNIVEVLCSMLRSAERHFDETRPETCHMTHLKKCFWCINMMYCMRKCFVAALPGCYSWFFNTEQFQFSLLEVKRGRKESEC